MQHLALGSGAEKFKEANIVDNTVRPELSKMGVMNPRRVFKLKSSSTPAAPAPVEPTPAAPAPVESAPKKVFKLKKSEVKEPEVKKTEDFDYGPVRLTTGDLEEAGLGSRKNKEIDKYIAKMKSMPVDKHPMDFVMDIQGWIHDNWNTFGQKPRDEIKKLSDDVPSYFEKMSKTKTIKAYKKIIAYLKTLRM